MPADGVSAPMTMSDEAGMCSVVFAKSNAVDVIVVKPSESRNQAARYTNVLRSRLISRHLSIPMALAGIDTDHYGFVRAGFEGTRRIDRRDWGVSWNTPLDSGGLLVSDKINLEFELSLVKDAPAGTEAEQRG